jgi:hypothetical protein
MKNANQAFDDLFINAPKEGVCEKIDSTASDKEDNSAEKTSESSSNSVVQKNKKKRLDPRIYFIVAGVTAICGALYFSFGREDVSVTQNIVAPQEQIIAAPEEAGSETGEEIEKLQSILAVRDAQISAYIAQIRRLQTDLAVTKNALQKIQAELTGYMALNRVETLREQDTEQFIKKVTIKGISLNSVYPGSAVLMHKNKTYVVRVGDTVNGVDILGIDSNNRQVRTSAGVIQ